MIESTVCWSYRLRCVLRALGGRVLRKTAINLPCCAQSDRTLEDMRWLKSTQTG